MYHHLSAIMNVFRSKPVVRPAKETAQLDEQSSPLESADGVKSKGNEKSQRTDKQDD